METPGTAPRRIPPCWYRHRDVVIELSWLCQEWLKIYTTSYGTPHRAGDWHDRYAPGVKPKMWFHRPSEFFPIYNHFVRVPSKDN